MQPPTNRDLIETKGVLLFSYYSDLCYLATFHKAKQNLISSEVYLEKKKKGSFPSFLWEFRVARNINAKEEKLPLLLKETFKWCKTQNCRDVEGYKNRIRSLRLVHDKDMTSLSSKILFLAKPTTVLPYDSLAKKTIGYTGKNYDDFITAVNKYKSANLQFINKLTKQVSPDLNKIEKVFTREVNHKLNFDKIRQNRILDKLLWTVGKNS